MPSRGPTSFSRQSGPRLRATSLAPKSVTVSLFPIYKRIYSDVTQIAHFEDLLRKKKNGPEHVRVYVSERLFDGLEGLSGSLALGLEIDEAERSDRHASHGETSN